MPDFGAGSDTVPSESVADTTSSKGIAVVSSATVNVKGAWTSLITATARETQHVTLTFAPTLTTTAAFLTFDIGIGAAAAEQVVIADVPYNAFTWYAGILQLPITIPAGVRVAARVSSSVASTTLRVGILLLAGGFAMPPGLSESDTYGITASTSTATSVDSGATVNVKGTWTQIVAATARPHSAFAVVLTMNAQNVASSGGLLLDIGIGAAGGEQVLISNLTIVIGATSEFMTPTSITVPIGLPSGSRVAVRTQSAIASTIIRVAVIGV